MTGGEAVHVLDTRNDYELRVGTFTNAIDLDIRTFRDFPKAIQRLPATMKDEPVVMFCTGGIRCEKASAIMMEAGFTNVMQLKGGVLGYFEEVGGDHWDGDCFVFDQRVAVTPRSRKSKSSSATPAENPFQWPSKPRPITLWVVLVPTASTG